MSYLFIKKDIEDIEMRRLLIKYLNELGYSRQDNSFIINDKQCVDYEIKYKRGASRCYLILKTKNNWNKGLEILQKFDDRIFKSDLQKYMEALRVFDGISLALSNKLYPKYAMYERYLRGFILLVLTKAYGTAWRNETVPDEELKKLCQKAKTKGSLSLTDTLEQFDVKQLEDYLFEPVSADYKDLFAKELSPNQLKSLSKEQICKIIDNNRPRSLWERNFVEFGPLEAWKNNILEVNECRNRIAHNKRILISDYDKYNNRINKINKELSKLIVDIRDKEFTDDSTVDVISSFMVSLCNTFNAFSKIDYTPLYTVLGQAIQNINIPQYKFNPEVANALMKIGDYSRMISMNTDSNIAQIAEAFEKTSKSLQYNKEDETKKNDDSNVDDKYV